MADESELPSLELVIKLMKMTTSSVDGEALTAMRKANEQLKKWSWDWEKLLRGKVTVIGDPFADLMRPTTKATPAPQTAPTPKAQAQAYAYAQSQAKPQARTLTFLCWKCGATFPLASAYHWNTNRYCQPCFKQVSVPKPKPNVPRQNSYAGPCVACTNYVQKLSGWIKRDALDTRWDVYCDPCYAANKPSQRKPSKAPPIDTLA